MLRNQGIYISKGSLNRYMQNGMRILKEYLEEPFKFEVQATDHMMTDDTAETVGVVDDGVMSYKKKYLWAFFAKLKNMVFQDCINQVKTKIFRLLYKLLESSFTLRMSRFWTQNSDAYA